MAHHFCSGWWSLVKGSVWLCQGSPNWHVPVQVPLAGLLWEALAAWESRGTHHAIQQPTNYTVTF